MKSKNGENKLRRYILEQWLPVGGGDWLEEDTRKTPRGDGDVSCRDWGAAHLTRTIWQPFLTCTRKTHAYHT